MNKGRIWRPLGFDFISNWLNFLCESRVLTQLVSVFLANIWVNWTIMNLVFSLKIFRFNKTSSRDHEGMRFSCLCCLVYVTQAHLQMDGTILSGLDLCTKQSRKFSHNSLMINLMDAFSQLKFPLTWWLKLASNWQIAAVWAGCVLFVLIKDKNNEGLIINIWLDFNMN